MIEREKDLLGRVAISRMGRDKNRAFLIIGNFDSEHVLLVDGRLRKWERPKKKKRKHVRVEPAAAESIKESLLKGMPVPDAEIRKSLIGLGYKLE